MAVKPLEPPDSFHLSAAVGWIELGNWREAEEELKKIAPAWRTHTNVLEIRWVLCGKAGDWERCVEIGHELVKAEAESSFGWVHRSFALHELKRTQEAADLLIPATILFPKEWLIRYNLACYSCQLGNHPEARKWLKAAMRLGDAKQVKLMASNDPDLEPLRAEIEGL